MSRLTRRTLGAGLLAGAWSSFAWGRDSALATPASLRAAAQAAAARAEPLVMLVSLPGCPYCELVRRNYLIPMRAEGLQAFQIDITDRRETILDFGERPSSGAELARRWKASITPTVLFFDSQGQEVAQRLTGVASLDFYGAYLDQSLTQARTSVRRNR